MGDSWYPAKIIDARPEKATTRRNPHHISIDGDAPERLLVITEGVPRPLRRLEEPL